MTSETKGNIWVSTDKAYLGEGDLAWQQQMRKEAGVCRARPRSATGTSSVTRSAGGGKSFPPNPPRLGGLVSTAASEFNREFILNYLLYSLRAAFIRTMSGAVTWQSVIAQRVSYLIGQERLYEGGNLSGRFYTLLVFLRGMNKQSVRSTRTHY